MNSITLTRMVTGDWYVSNVKSDKKKYSITNILGGKSIVRAVSRRSKRYVGYYCVCYVNDTDIEEAKLSAKNNNYEVILIDNVY